MAKKGVRKVWFGKLNEETGLYSNLKYFGKTSQLNGTVTKATGDDYGDDELAEHDEIVTGGELTWESNTDKDEMYAYLLGHQIDAETGELVINADDIAPFVGVGCVTQADGKWIGKFYPKTKFSEPSDDNSTVTDSITYGHVTLTGAIYLDASKNLKFRKTFDTSTEAEQWVKNKMGGGADETPSVSVVPSRAVVGVGERATLRAITAPEGAEVTWSSSATNKATVDSNGIVTGVEAGSATITATITVDTTNYTDTCSVTVE